MKLFPRLQAAKKMIEATTCRTMTMASGPSGSGVGSNLLCYVVRLGPGEEIRTKLLDFVATHDLKAAFIMSCVGSVQSAKLRLAQATATSRNHVLTLEGKYEIVSLVGTLSDGGHLHASLADDKGGVVGGHVLGEMVVFTTAEVVIGECSQLVFNREMDTRTGFNELVITPKL